MDNEEEENDDQVYAHSLQLLTCTKVAGSLDLGLVAPGVHYWQHYACMFFGSCICRVCHEQGMP